MWFWICRAMNVLFSIKNHNWFVNGNVCWLKQRFKSFALGRLRQSTYFELDDPSFLRKKLPIRWKVPDLDGENMSDGASFLVGVRGSSITVFFSGSGLLNMLPHLSHLSAMKSEKKNETEFNFTKWKLLRKHRKILIKWHNFKNNSQSAIIQQEQSCKDLFQKRNVSIECVCEKKTMQVISTDGLNVLSSVRLKL